MSCCYRAVNIGWNIFFLAFCRISWRQSEANLWPFNYTICHCLTIRSSETWAWKCQNHHMNSWVNLFCEVTVNLDLWPTTSNQFIRESSGHCAKFEGISSGCNWDIANTSMGRTDGQPECPLPWLSVARMLKKNVCGWTIPLIWLGINREAIKKTKFAPLKLTHITRHPGLLFPHRSPSWTRVQIKLCRFKDILPLNRADTNPRRWWWVVFKPFPS